jgi:tetratricopeptide (TPR) repeat protein
VEQIPPPFLQFLQIKKGRTLPSHFGMLYRLILFVFIALLVVKETPSHSLLPWKGRSFAASVIIGSQLVFNPFAINTGTILLANDRVVGVTVVDGEANSIFRKGRQCESDGNLDEAKSYYEQVIEVEPTFIFAWANLGNVLVTKGELNDALLCYKKAISLYPPKDQLSIILLNKASVEAALGNQQLALKDIETAEKISGTTPDILTNKAVLLTNENKWKEATELFEKCVSTADRNALPWWLRYSMSLLETDRPMEAVAFLQRVMKSFPYEIECKAFACSLYNALGSKVEAKRYWSEIDPVNRSLYSDKQYVKTKLKWGNKAVSSFYDFLDSKYSKVE